jgi:hypothetical protein
VDQLARDRRRASRFRAAPEGSAGRRHRRPRQHFGHWTLLAADVVDELRLVIAPTIVGSGQRLFDGLPLIRLETIRSTASPSDHLLVEYRVVR